jgi:hypothetical protein
MDTATAFAQRRQESAAPTTSGDTPDASRTLAVTATYLLSEEGRKAWLLTGGDGRAVQQLNVQVPANRLHLVGVDANGFARLKLRPRYQQDGEQRVVRIDSAPVYDAPPDVEELFREAARNHQLERAYHTERQGAKIKRREISLDRRAAVAQTFLSDPTQRALVHPAPTPKRCFITTEHGRVMFDANTDIGPARDVPLEAHRRFRGDQRARRERNLQDRSAQLALHEEKKRCVAEWIAAHGSREQQARHAAGVLPIEEAIEAITDRTFGLLADRPRYLHDGVAMLQALVRQSSQQADAVIARDDIIVTSVNAAQATAAQWALVQEFQAMLPEATVMLRLHKVALKRDVRAALAPIFGVLVSQRIGPFTLRREYEAPQG